MRIALRLGIMLGMQSRTDQTPKGAGRDSQIHRQPQKTPIGRMMGKLLGFEGKFTKPPEARDIPHKIDIRREMIGPNPADERRYETRMRIETASQDHRLVFLGLEAVLFTIQLSESLLGHLG